MTTTPPPREPGTVHLDGDQLLALAHPLRMRLLAVLRLDGPSTASALADRLDTSSGRTSYHLRQLAAAGLVEEDHDRGNARDRWWVASHSETSWSDTQFVDDPDTAAAADWLLGHVVRIHADQSSGWAASHRDWPASWVDASTMSDHFLRLTPDRLQAMNAELRAVVDRYTAEEAAPDDPDAERCTVIIHAFPNPEPAL